MIKLKRGLYQSEATGRKYRMARQKSVVKRLGGCLATQLYMAWASMKDRCDKPHHHAYKNYGGRGIEVCEEWYDFGRFRDWALANGFRAAGRAAPRGDQPSIDRINVDEGYCPENCRWIKQRINSGADNQGMRHHRATVPFADVQRARGMAAAGVTHRDIADAYGVTRATVTQWVSNRRRVRA